MGEAQLHAGPASTDYRLAFTDEFGPSGPLRYRLQTVRERRIRHMRQNRQGLREGSPGSGPLERRNVFGALGAYTAWSPLSLPRT